MPEIFFHPLLRCSSHHETLLRMHAERFHGIRESLFIHRRYAITCRSQGISGHSSDQLFAAAHWRNWSYRSNGTNRSHRTYRSNGCYRTTRNRGYWSYGANWGDWGDWTKYYFSNWNCDNWCTWKYC